MDPNAGPWAAEVASQSDTIQMLMYGMGAMAAPIAASVANMFVSSEPKSGVGKVIKKVITALSMAYGKAKVNPADQ